MLDKIELAEKKYKVEFDAVNNLESIEELRIKYLGRKGIFTELFEEFKQLPKDEKPKYGQMLNKAKSFAQNEFDVLKSKLEKLASDKKKYIDLTLDGRCLELGSKHILTQTLDEIKQIFKGLGFSIYEGPELESDHNNFEMLNFPADHPARDMQDTFFINDKFFTHAYFSGSS